MPQLRSIRSAFHRARTPLATACVAFSALSAAVADDIPGYVVLPLVPVSRANQATLRFTLNGQRTMLVLDTGAPTTILDESFYRGTHPKSATITANDLPPELRKNLNANGQRAAIGTIDTFEANGKDFGKRQVMLTSLSESFNQYNNYNSRNSIGGFLGADFLREHAALIDWKRRGVYLNTDPKRRAKLGPAFASAGWTAVPMSRTSGQHFTVPATVSGKQVRLLVDTGAQFTTFNEGVVPLTVVHNREDMRSSMFRLNSTTSTMSMIGGDMNSYPARIDDWKIGSYQASPWVVITSKIPKNFLTEQSAGEGPILGLLGAEVLAANNAVVDIGGETLYLKRK